MGKHDGMKLVIVVFVFCLLPLNVNADDMSIGEIITKFVTDSFLGDSFSDFENVGKTVKDTAKKILPILDIEDIYEKVKLTAMIFKVLKAIGIPEEIDIDAQFAILRKISNMADDMKGFGNGIKEIASELGSTDGLLAIGGGIAVDAYGNGRLSEEKADNLDVGKNEELKIDKKESLDLKTDLGLDLEKGNLGMKNETLGLAAGNQILLNVDTYGAGTPKELPNRVILDVLEKFLKLIVDNMEFVSQVSDVVDQIEYFTDVESKMSEYIDSQSDEFLSQYGIKSSDIMDAKKMVQGKMEMSDPEVMKKMFQILGKDSDTLRTINELIEITDSIENTDNLDRGQALGLLIRVVNVIPNTASAIDDLVP